MSTAQANIYTDWDISDAIHSIENLQNGFADVEDAIDRMSDEVVSALRDMSGSFSKTDKSLDNTKAHTSAFHEVVTGAFRRIGELAVNAVLELGRMAMEAGRYLMEIGKSALSSASNFEEMQNKFNVVFKGMEEEAMGFSKVLVNSYAMSTTESFKFLSSVQDLLVPMGMAREEAGKMSFNVVKLAADLGSFNNLGTEEVMADMQSALVGNYETMKKYGIVLNETTVKQEAANMGYEVGTGVLDPLVKAQAAYSLMLKGSADAQGDMARSADSYANRLKVLIAVKEDLLAMLGKSFMPMLAEVYKKLAEFGDKLMPILAAISERYTKVVGEFATKLMDLAEQAMPWVTAGLMELADWLEYGIDLVFDEWIPKLAEFGENLIILGTQTLPIIWDAFQFFGNQLVKIFDWMTFTGIPTLIGFIEQVRTSSDDINKVFTLLWESVGFAAEWGMSKLKEKFYDALGAITKAIYELDLWEALTGVLDKTSAKFWLFWDYQMDILKESLKHPFTSAEEITAPLYEGYLNNLDALDKQFTYERTQRWGDSAAQEIETQENLKNSIDTKYEEMKGLVLDKVDLMFKGIEGQTTEFGEKWGQHGVGVGTKFGKGVQQGIYHALPIQTRELQIIRYGEQIAEALEEGYKNVTQTWVTDMNSDLFEAGQSLDRWARYHYTKLGETHEETEAAFKAHFEKLKADMFDFESYAALYGTDAALEYQKAFDAEWEAVMVPAYNKAFSKFEEEAKAAGAAGGEGMAQSFMAGFNWSSAFSSMGGTGYSYTEYIWPMPPPYSPEHWRQVNGQWQRHDTGANAWLPDQPTQEMLSYWGLALTGGLVDVFKKVIPMSFLKGGEVPIIAHAGEAIIPTKESGYNFNGLQMDNGKLTGAAGSKIELHIHGELIDADGLERAALKIGRQIKTMMNRGYNVI